MNFELVYDKWWLSCGMISAALLLWFLYRIDSEFGDCESDKIKTDFMLFCNVGTIFMTEKSMEPWYVQGCLGGMFLYLTVTGVMDCRLHMISDFLHLIGILSAGTLAFLSCVDSKVWWELIIFCLIQYFVFRHMYGAADVALYMVCALYLAAEGGGMKIYLLHMALTFLLLGIIQIVCGNISKCGNLKKPVALAPYIAISFFMIN